MERHTRELKFDRGVAEITIGKICVYVVQKPNGLRVSAWRKHDHLLGVNGCTEEQAQTVLDAIEKLYPEEVILAD